VIAMNLSEAAAIVAGTLRGPDAAFAGCTTDSRRVRKNELFIALRGERFDGHEFVAASCRAGAGAAMVERAVEGCPSLIIVNDSRHAMGTLAGNWRGRFDMPFIAITGSNGKTTVKEMVNAILSQNANVLATTGNQNNEIGVPLTLFRLGEEHGFGVLEMGANHAGEIRYLSGLARPAVAVITQCARAHLEGFGSIEGVAEAKAEIFDGLLQGGTAIINADDQFAGFWRRRSAAYAQLTFGIATPADVCASGIRSDPAEGAVRFRLHCEGGDTSVKLNLAGVHNVANALAAAACCIALGVPLDVIRSGLERVQPVKGRLQHRQGANGARVIDDTYNANPASLAAALAAAAALPGRKWLVLGDMGELGDTGATLHREAGALARARGFERLYGLGPLCRAAVEGFGAGARHFDVAEDLVDALREGLAPDVTVLVKGSRAMAMERVVAALAGGH
jgi:UDP-N-acetylmuramoyl-tripeptide--D-alanyl-D-alanine ligase